MSETVYMRISTQNIACSQREREREREAICVSVCMYEHYVPVSAHACIHTYIHTYIMRESERTLERSSIHGNATRLNEAIPLIACLISRLHVWPSCVTSQHPCGPTAAAPARAIAVSRDSVHDRWCAAL